MRNYLEKKNTPHRYPWSIQLIHYPIFYRIIRVTPMRQSLPPCVPSTASFLLFMMIRPQKSTAVHCLTTFHGKWFRMVNHTIPTCPQHNIFGRDLENIMLQCQLTSTTIFLAVCLVSRCLPLHFYSSNLILGRLEPQNFCDNGTEHGIQLITYPETIRLTTKETGSVFDFVTYFTWFL